MFSNPDHQTVSPSFNPVNITQILGQSNPIDPLNATGEYLHLLPIQREMSGMDRVNRSF